MSWGAPIKLFDLELGRPLEPLAVEPTYQWAQCLVRLHGRPIGVVALPRVGSGCTVAALEAVIVAQLGQAIRVRLVEQGLDLPATEQGLRLDQLAASGPVEAARPFPFVTVAVCTRERPDDLAACLEAIARLDYPNYEVVVIDNAPRSDRVEQLVKTRYPRVRYFAEPRPGLDWARNRAILEAGGEIIAFTDDDVIVDPRWLTAITREFVENPAVMAVTGLVVPAELETDSQVQFEWYNGFGKGYRRRWFERGRDQVGRSFLMHGAGQFGTGANMAFRRSVFDQVGFFDPALDVGTPTNGGGDLDMYFRVLKAGHALFYEPDAVVRHRHRSDPKSLRYQIEGWGSGFFAFAIRAAEAFPDERAGFREVTRWWLRYWFLKRLVKSIRRSDRWQAKLVWAEARAAWGARSSYRAAQRQALASTREFGPQVPEARLAPKLVNPYVSGEAREPAGVRQVELSIPLAPITNLDQFDSVMVFVSVRGRVIGKVEISNYHRDIGVTTLRQEIAASCWYELLEEIQGPGLDPSLDTEPGGLRAMLRRYRFQGAGETAPALPTSVPVSVIVGTYDRPDDLRWCLKSLEDQRSGRPIEIIVADNHPKSGLTAPVVAEFPGVRLVQESRAGSSYARNAAISASHGAIILSTDDDVIVPPEWVERLITPMADPAVMIVTGNVLPLELATPSQRLFEHYGGLSRGFRRATFNQDWFAWFRRDAVPTWDLGGTANAAFRAEIFGDPAIGLMDERLGPGTPTGVGEDTYIFYRTLKAGHLVVYEPGAHVWHRHRREMAGLERQIYNYSKGHVAYHLVTLFDDGDKRVLWRLGWWLPMWHARRLVRWVRGRRDYPLRLLVAEIRGNLAGPWSLWQSSRRVRRLGKSGVTEPADLRTSAVSVVVPAFQAADTIEPTLESIRAQTWTNWEVVVVDDGSSDRTSELVSAWAERDPRIRLVVGAHQGVSAARNVGIEAARHDLLLFLDADDEISPLHLERLVGSLAADPEAGAAYSQWVRVAGDGTAAPGITCTRSGDLFDLLGKASQFPIHSCLVRRRCLDQVGLFDPSLKTGEDWDLWQRVARTGARFISIPDPSARYRMRPGSASMDPRQMLIDGLLVLARGHSADPRVQAPKPEHAAGLGPAGLAAARYLYACWPAGLEIGRGGEACDLLADLAGERAPNLDHRWVATVLLPALSLPRALAPHQAFALWPEVGPGIERFLALLERQTGAPGLARKATRSLEEMALQQCPEPRPLTIGRSHAVRLELTEPFGAVVPPPGVEVLTISMALEGRPIGTVDLPVFDGGVPATVILDAVAAEAAWKILGGYWSRTIYRGALELARATEPIPEGDPWDARVHQVVGWTVLLQEIWGRAGWRLGDFYDPGRPDDGRQPGSLVAVAGNTVSIEISAGLPTLEGGADRIWVDTHVGGRSIGWIPVANPTGRIGPHELRVAITTVAGMELCRATVREALLGDSFGRPGTLRERLVEATARNLAADGLVDSVPGSLAMLLGRHPTGKVGSSVSRRATLPRQFLDDALDLARATGQPVSPIGVGLTTGPVRYRPEFLGPPPPDQVPNPEPPPVRAVGSRYDRHHFESLFAAGADPWKYQSEYERLKYLQTLNLVPEGAQSVLELACAEGDFTVALARRVNRVTAADISVVALERAARRCAELTNVDFIRLDLMTDPLPAGFDAIVCSEVLYYVGLARLPEIAARLAAALVPGGRMVLAHANVVADGPEEAGFDWGLPYGAKTIGRVLASEPALRFTKEFRTPHYRIQVLSRREPDAPDGPSSGEPETVELGPSVAPVARVASTFRAAGAGPAVVLLEEPVVTTHLPILMYHRVAPSGAESNRRYRVTPEELDRQLEYLAANGFVGVTIEQWARAVEARKPLPGRAVLLTFDDGYRDFAEHAWPLLQRHGFGATVFLVVDQVGGFNAWDEALGERVPLLGWDEIRDLAAQGARFGSHACSHRSLTSLAPAEVAGEFLRSRTRLECELSGSSTAVAYPFGDTDRVVEHLAGASGFLFGFSYLERKARFEDRLLALPRIEVSGTDPFEGFVAKIGPGFDR